MAVSAERLSAGCRCLTLQRTGASLRRNWTSHRGTGSVPAMEPNLMSKRVLLFALVLAVMLERNAHAYLDPASGSLLLQLLVGGVAGAAVLIKMYWRRLVERFSPKKKDDGRQA